MLAQLRVSQGSQAVKFRLVSLKNFALPLRSKAVPVDLFATLPPLALANVRLDIHPWH